MNIEDLEKCIARILAKPLRLVCRTPKGDERIMTARECRRSGSTYIHIAGMDELDSLLEKELGAKNKKPEGDCSPSG